MSVLYAILLILAMLCFIGYATGRTITSGNLLGLGLFFWVLVPLLQQLDKIF